jgi:hypothetical protein
MATSPWWNPSLVSNTWSTIKFSLHTFMISTRLLLVSVVKMTGPKSEMTVSEVKNSLFFVTVISGLLLVWQVVWLY